MALITWQKAYCIGHPLVDQQHQKLVGLLNTLYEAETNEEGMDKCMASTLTELAHYARDHFRDEEHLMQQIGFPGLPDHSRLHKALVNQLVGILRDLRNDRSVAVSDLITFLKNWLMDHIIAEDSKIGAYLRAGQKLSSSASV